MIEKNRRLANVKTRAQSGFDYVLQSLHIKTPFGKKQLKELAPFFPGEEKNLTDELDRLEALLHFLRKEQQCMEAVDEIFHEIKDVSYTLERAKTSVLTVVELFEIKGLLLLMQRLKKVTEESRQPIPAKYLLEDTEKVLDLLDPGKERLNTFYIYDGFSPKLGELRKERRELELELRREQKQIKLYLKETFSIELTPKFDIMISKSKPHELAKVREISELVVSDEDYMSVTFGLRPTEITDSIQRSMDKLKEEIEEEEQVVRAYLSGEIGKNQPLIAGNCLKIGLLDFALARLFYAEKHGCIRPEIIEGHSIEIEDGRHLHVEDVLTSKGKTYCPISLKLSPGATCITGANMGGKTVSLKLVGLVVLLAQYGFFVPCKKARLGLSSYVQMLIGDSQSVERGLSSFGSEMEELKEMMDLSKDRSLLLIDEIASGTNPVEGFALSKSIVSYLQKHPYISLITTHFDNVTTVEGVKNLQVVGLAGVDFEKLNREIRYANRKERILIIGNYMDYRLQLVEEKKEIPKDALNIAKMLGIGDEIIEQAKIYIDKEEGR